MIAGLTVGLTVIPQGLAYSVIAGLPPQVCLCVRLCVFMVLWLWGGRSVGRSVLLNVTPQGGPALFSAF